MYLHVWKRRIKVNKAEKRNADSKDGWAKVKDLRGEDEFEERYILSEHCLSMVTKNQNRLLLPSRKGGQAYRHTRAETTGNTVAAEAGEDQTVKTPVHLHNLTGFLKSLVS